MNVTTIEPHSACCDCGTSMYGKSGSNPPITYEPPMRIALSGARRGSGFSKPNSKRIMKSTQCFLSAVIVSTSCSQRVTINAVAGEDRFDFASFLIHGMPSFVSGVFAAPFALAVVIADIGASREVALESHRDAAGCEFGNARRHDDVRGCDRSADPGRQRRTARR